MDLFTACNPPNRKTNKEVHEDYAGFVEKFKPKKTTDDCYTPAAVYGAVVGWVREHAPIEGCEIVRPFWPGGDYENYDYPANCVVIDNPPFSIISKITRFYTKRGLRFFLFAPQLTLFSICADGCTHIITNADIVYANGAIVRTGFVSNLFGDTRILVVPFLGAELERLSTVGTLKKAIPKYVYPDHVITVSRLAGLAARGQSLAIPASAVYHTSRLDAQAVEGKGIFGSGYLCSDAMATTIRVREQAVREQAVREQAVREQAVREQAVVWGLSDREREIIKTLQ